MHHVEAIITIYIKEMLVVSITCLILTPSIAKPWTRTWIVQQRNSFRCCQVVKMPMISRMDTEDSYSCPDRGVAIYRYWVLGLKSGQLIKHGNHQPKFENPISNNMCLGDIQD